MMWTVSDAPGTMRSGTERRNRGSSSGAGMDGLLVTTISQGSEVEEAWIHEGHSKERQENQEGSLKPGAHEEDPSGDSALESDDFGDVPGTTPSPPISQATHGPQWRGAQGKSPKNAATRALGELWKCEDCGKAFRYCSAFTLHRRTHTGEKPFACPECGRSFSQRVHLTLHQRVHTGEQPHTCDKCGKGFSQGSYLAAHWRTHTGKRPHKCPDCGKAFRNRAYLIQHHIVHTGERPYECCGCGRAFIFFSALIRHQRTHMDKKPHRRSLFRDSTAQPPHLTGHLHSPGNEKPVSSSDPAKTSKDQQNKS